MKNPHTHKHTFYLKGVIQSNQLVTLMTIMLIVLTNSLSAQSLVNLDWNQTTGLPDTVNWSASELDGYNHLIVVGNTSSGVGNTDILISQYHKNGTLIWQDTYDFDGYRDYGVAVTCDNSGNIYVAGVVSDSLGLTDMMILKYSNSGTLLWEEVWSGGNGLWDSPSCMVFDNDNDALYVGGVTYSLSAMSDYVVLKIEDGGTLLWESFYDYNQLYEFLTGIKIKTGGYDIIVTGASANAVNNYDYATLKIDYTDGSILEETRVNITGLGLDQALAIAQDTSGNFYITGFNETAGDKNIQTVKIDTAFTVAWVQNWGGSGQDDTGTSIATDSEGNVYVSGSSETTQGGKEWVLLKYDSDGTFVWEKKHYPPNPSLIAEAIKVVCNNHDKIIVSGHIHDLNQNLDFLTITYNSDGTIDWLRQYDNNGNTDKVLSLNVDNNGNVFVTGTTQDTLPNPEYLLIKYAALTLPPVPIVKDSLGNPLYFGNTFIVKFDSSIVNKDIVNSGRAILYGSPHSMLTPAGKTAFNSCVPTGRYTLVKAFPSLTTNDTVAISRLNERIPTPDFWSTFWVVAHQTVDAKAVCEVLSNNDRIEYAHLNYCIQQTSNDPDYSTQVSLHAGYNLNNIYYDSAHINMELAWDIWDNGVNHANIRVGVFDDGVRWSDKDFLYDTTAAQLHMESVVRGGWDFENYMYASPSNTNFGTGHGTSVSGIIGAIRNNSFEIAGVAGGSWEDSIKGASIYSMRIFNSDLFNTLDTIIPFCQLCYLSDAIAGASDYDPDNYPYAWFSNDYNFGLNVSNHSYNFYPYDGYSQEEVEIVGKAMHYANRMKVIQVCSSGNQGEHIIKQFLKSYPASYDDDWVIRVGASNSVGLYDSYSNYWENMDIIAPGDQNVVRTISGGIFNGTSASAPHVTGLIALMTSYFNQDTSAFSNLAPEDVEFLLELSADDVQNYPCTLGYDIYSGYGKVNAGKAMQWIEKPYYHLRHFTTDSLSHSFQYQLTQSNLPMKISETYSVSPTLKLKRHKNYKIDQYSVSALVTHSYPSNEIAKYSWERHSSSSLFQELDTLGGVYVFTPHEKVYIDSISYNQSTLHGFIYHVKDSLGNHLAWIPYDTAQIDIKSRVDYSILTKDTLFITHLDLKEDNHFITIYPNPSDQQIRILVKGVDTGKVTFKILDILGRTMNITEADKPASADAAFDMQIGYLSSGVYYLECRLGESRYFTSFIKQ
ncbi:MAG: S8 family serine peptidase [Bacteroidia bacterium]|nr:S8 family serine peptidase [Bacteroidia bacterium]